MANLDLNTEKEFLGSLINYGGVDKVIDLIKVEHFTSSETRDVWQTIYELFSQGKTIDSITVYEQAKKMGVR